jgi:hypothetical protein
MYKNHNFNYKTIQKVEKKTIFCKKRKLINKRFFLKTKKFLIKK